MADFSTTLPNQADHMRVIFRTIMARCKIMTGLWRTRNHPHLRDISQRLGQDSAIPQSDIDRHQHEFPSDRTRHPML